MVFDVRDEMARRYARARVAVDGWYRFWLLRAELVQRVAAVLDGLCSGLALGEMAGYEPRLCVFVDSREQEAAVYRAVDELYRVRSADWHSDIDGNALLRFEGSAAGDDWPAGWFWLVVLPVGDE